MICLCHLLIDICPDAVFDTVFAVVCSAVGPITCNVHTYTHASRPNAAVAAASTPQYGMHIMATVMMPSAHRLSAQESREAHVQRGPTTPASSTSRTTHRSGLRRSWRSLSCRPSPVTSTAASPLASSPKSTRYPRSSLRQPGSPAPAVSVCDGGRPGFAPGPSLLWACT